MSMGKESYFWHKLHSLTGIIPVGFYVVQHLTLNSFSYAGPERFNGVIHFFESIPFHVFVFVQALIWGSVLFHGVYGLFIVNRGESNYFSTKYKWSQNRMYTFQRWSGIYLFFFIIYHVVSTSINAKINGKEVVEYASWAERLTSYGGLIAVVYALGVMFAAYHLAYGIWNFCIRWGITISDRAQLSVQKFAGVLFVAVTVIGWVALAGFFLHKPGTGTQISVDRADTTISVPVSLNR